MFQIHLIFCKYEHEQIDGLFFFFTNISAFYFPSIQLQKNYTSVTTCHRVDLASVAFLSKLPCGCVVF